MEPSFLTPQDAEAAFYQALERADLTAMMAVWAEDEEIVCVHPGGPRHLGFTEVRDSWRRLFLQGPQLRFQLSGEKVFSGRLLSIHTVYENVTLISNPQSVSAVVATNIYLLTSRGWRMLVHHGSPLAAGKESRETAPSILH
jgi:ketosteroid isomerase-like protein